MFSDRMPRRLTANRLTRAVQARRAEGCAVIDLTESNPTRAGFEYPGDLLNRLADARSLVYEPSPLGRLETRRAIACDYERQGLSVPPERIVLTVSTSEAYSLLLKLLADGGDEVLVPRPSYPLFEQLVDLDLVDARPYDLEYHGAWSIDFDSFERAFSPRTRAVILVSPNNPTGSFVSREELDRVASYCAARDVAIVADEVFADYELEPGARHRAGRAPECRKALSFALGGLSKSVGLPQVKLGWFAVSGPDALVAAALERLELVCDTYLSVSSPVQVAAADFLARGATVRRQIAARVNDNYRKLGALTAKAPSCRLLASDGGWYAVVQVPTLEPEEDLVLRVLAHDGVLVYPGYFFDFQRESFIVVSLLTREPVFAEGVGRLLRHFDCTGTSQRHV